MRQLYYNFRGIPQIKSHLKELLSKILFWNIWLWKYSHFVYGGSECVLHQWTECFCFALFIFCFVFVQALRGLTFYRLTNNLVHSTTKTWPTVPHKTIFYVYLVWQWQPVALLVRASTLWPSGHTTNAGGWRFDPRKEVSFHFCYVIQTVGLAQGEEGVGGSPNTPDTPHPNLPLLR